MATHLYLGALALKLGVNYNRLYRRVKLGTPLPGQILVGQDRAFAVKKVEEIREQLKREGVIREEEMVAA